MLLLLVDIVSRSVLGIFDHLGASYSQQLNQPGSAQVRLALTADGPAGQTWAERVGFDAAGVAKTFAYLVNEVTGDVEWWGVPWGADIAVDGRTMQLRCSGVGSLFAARAKRVDTTWTNTDQATIVKALLDEAQTGTRRDLYIDTVSGIVATGILRTRTILGAERHYIGELIAEMSAWIDGYDFRYDAAWTGGGTAPTHVFNLLYPAPRTSPVTTLIATGPISITSWKIDGLTVATDVDAIGNQLVATETQPVPLLTYPAIDRSVTHSSTTELATLSKWALRYLAAATKPRQSGTFRALLGDHDRPPVQPGDAVRLVETDLLGVDATMVVTDMRVAQAGTGRIVDYTLADATTLVRTNEMR